MSTQFPHPHLRIAIGLLSAIVAVFLLLSLSAVPGPAGQPSAFPVITDRAELHANNLFSMPANQFRLAGNGDVFFTSGNNTGLFRWDSVSRTRVRLLQTNDPLTVLQIEDLPREFADSPLDQVAASLSLQVNAVGHAAMLVTAAIVGERNPAGIFLYDGSSYRFVVGTGNGAPGTDGQEFGAFSSVFLNDNDRVALLGNLEPLGFGPMGIFMETPAGHLVKVALQREEAPGTGGGTFQNLQIIGFNNAGQLAFLADVQGGNTNRAVYVDDGSGPKLVVGSGMPAPGTSGNFNLRTIGAYFLNGAGKVAFISDASDGKVGIWIGSSSASPVKLMVRGDATGIAGWGNYAGTITLRGFNNAGQALFDSGIIGTPNAALFLKDLSNPTQYIYFRGQLGGPGGDSFDQIGQAALNSGGKVAFLVRSSSFQWGLYLGSGTSLPSAIVTQGQHTPIGGTYGLAGRNIPALINDTGQVLFLADLPDSRAVGLFRWAPESGIRPVVSSMDTLPGGATTILRPILPVVRDTEVLVTVRKAGGQMAVYAKSLDPGMGGMRRIVTEFETVEDAGTVVSPGDFAMNQKGEIVFVAALLDANSYPRGGMLANLPGRGLVRAILSGSSAPGGGDYWTFTATMLNRQSKVAYYANTSTGAGIFVASEAIGDQAIVRVGDPWPDGGGTIGSLTVAVQLNDSSQVAFRASRSGTGPQPTGIFVGSGTGVPVKVVSIGDAAPGGGVFNSVATGFRLNASGQVAFSAGIAGGSSGGGVFLGSAGGPVQAIALIGQPATGTTGTFSFFNPNTVELNNSGQVAFWAGLNGPDILNGWYLGSVGGAPSPRLLHRQPLPGGGEADLLASGARLVALADTGEMAISVANGATGEHLPLIIIAGAHGALRSFAASAEKADATGSEFALIYSPLSVTPAGRFIFFAVLAGGPARAGVFINSAN